MSACGQRGREENITGGSWVIGVGEAGLSAPAAQRLIRKGALQRSSRRLKRKSGSDGFIPAERLTSAWSERFLTGSLCGASPGLSMMISFFRSSSMVLL